MKSIVTLIIIFLFILQAAGCGSSNSKKQGDPKSQGQSQGQNQGQSKPIDSALKEQMNMYKTIKQYEYEEADKVRKADKEQLKKMLKEQENTGKAKSGQKTKEKTNKK